MTDNTTAPPEAIESPQDDKQATAELAKPEDISSYAEERREQDESEETGEPVKKASRYERLKRARDSYRAENEDLKRRLGQEPEAAPEAPENPYEADIEVGRRDAEIQYEMQERERLAALDASFRTRAEAVAPQYPDFQEVISTANDLGIEVPPTLEQMVKQSAYGPQIAYALAKDALMPDGQGLLARFQELAGDPVGIAREFGSMEQSLRTFLGAKQASPTRKATSAPPPVRPVSGGSAGAPKDLHALAAKDNIADYAKARRRQEHA